MVRVLIFVSLIVAAVLAAPITTSEAMGHQAQAPFRRAEEVLQGSFLQNIQALLLDLWAQFVQNLPPSIAELCL